jgi:hypothetical protein
MFENTTVTLSLQDFDELRRGHAAHRQIASWLSDCFTYTCTPNPQPQECEKCDKDLFTEKWNGSNTECCECEIFQNNPEYTETLAVDVARLIRIAKEYSLYGKDAETDIDKLTVTELRA